MNPHSKSPYNLDDEDTVSAIDELSLWSAPFGMKLLDTIVLNKNMTVLDIGFGLGFPLMEIALRLGKGSKVYGIDPWKAAAARAKKKIEIFGIKNAELIEGVAENIPLPDASVDLIVSNNGINNVQDIEKVFKECCRIAKPGAQFVATVNLQETMIEFYTIFESVLADSGLAEVVPKLKDHIHTKRRPVEEFKKLFNNNYFEITRVIHDSFKFRYLDGTSMLNHPFIRYAFMDSWIDVIPPSMVDKVFTEIESRMNNVSKGKGEWVVTIPFIVIDARKKSFA
jgi:ubiquinone/menaquinone biosynthesis C-methylase UbiE